MAATVRSLRTARDQIDRLRESTKRLRKKADEVGTTVVRSGITGGTAFGLGYVRGRYGPKEFFGVPMSLAIAVGAHALPFFGMKKSSEHFQSVGDGALACFLTEQGYELGKAAASGTAGLAGPYAARGLPDRDLDMAGGLGLDMDDLEDAELVGGFDYEDAV